MKREALLAPNEYNIVEEFEKYAQDPEKMHVLFVVKMDRWKQSLMQDY